MKVRRYFVKDMREGMDLIRKEMGAEAVIISTRKLRHPGFKGIFMPRRLEVTAAVAGKGREELTRGAAGADDLACLKTDVASLKEMLKRLLAGEQNTEDTVQENSVMEEWKNHFSIHDLDEVLLAGIFEEIKESLSGEVHITKDIAAMILEKKVRSFFRIAPEKQERCQVFLGPTGVGKTTTMAKIAARYAFFYKEKVGLITIDHYRIGAIEQLRTYSEILDLPLEVIMSPRDIVPAMRSLEHCDRILVDTAGRGTRNSVQIGELANYIRHFEEAEKFLVVSATTKKGDLRLTAENFRRLDYNRLIYTKLDETDSFGIFVNGSHYAGVPVVYITNGQNVPDDLELANPDKFCSLLMGAETVA